MGSTDSGHFDSEAEESITNQEEDLSEEVSLTTGIYSLYRAAYCSPYTAGTLLKLLVPCWRIGLRESWARLLFLFRINGNIPYESLSQQLVPRSL